MTATSPASASAAEFTTGVDRQDLVVMVGAEHLLMSERVGRMEVGVIMVMEVKTVMVEVVRTK